MPRSNLHIFIIDYIQLQAAENSCSLSKGTALRCSMVWQTSQLISSRTQVPSSFSSVTCPQKLLAQLGYKLATMVSGTPSRSLKERSGLFPVCVWEAGGRYENQENLSQKAPSQLPFTSPQLGWYQISVPGTVTSQRKQDHDEFVRKVPLVLLMEPSSQ